MRILFFFLFFFLSSLTVAQKTDAGLTDSYAFYIKSIDDFFDRFNFKKKSEFYRYVSTYYSSVEFSRKRFVAQLFKIPAAPKTKSKSQTPAKGKSLAKANLAIFNQEEAKLFLGDVCNSTHPTYLHYSDNDWYAELSCKVLYMKKPFKLTLILKVEHLNDNAFTWSVVGADASFFKMIKTNANEKSLQCDSTYKRKNFLSPISHGLEFQDVRKIFDAKNHAQDFIHAGLKSESTDKLLLLIKNSEIKFVQVNRITYHLMQIEDWQLRIEKFKMKDRNSGWLISSLVRADNIQKKEFRRKKLFLPELFNLEKN